MAKTFNTIHIFSFGLVQIISKSGSVSKPAESLTKLQALIDNVWGQKADDYTGTKNYHAINIFEGMFADWQAKAQGEKGYRIEYVKLDAIIIQDLIDEMLYVEPVAIPDVAPVVDDTVATDQLNTIVTEIQTATANKPSLLKRVLNFFTKSTTPAVATPTEVVQTDAPPTTP